MPNKQNLTERDICSQYINPALQQAGWDFATQVREEVSFTKGRVIVRGKLHGRGQQKRADYILYFAPNLPIAVIEAKDNTHAVGAGMQQALGYAESLAIPFAFSSNGDAFQMHDRTGQSTPIERQLTLANFPSPADLWQRYCCWKGIASPEKRATVETPYHDDGSGKTPRYYQVNAINSCIEAIARGQKRILLVMATGTGKSYTAFQIIWRLWKSRNKKRILFLADRNILVDLKNEIQEADDILSSRRIHELLDIARSEQVDGRRLLVATSTHPRKHLPEGEWPAHCDFLMPHGNNSMPHAWRRELEAFVRDPRVADPPRPICCNEDSIDIANLDVSIDQGVSWGYYDQGYGCAEKQGKHDWTRLPREAACESLSGFQTVPVNWTINTPHKRAFFERLKTITGSHGIVR